jgi:hypothetical protein
MIIAEASSDSLDSPERSSFPALIGRTNLPDGAKLTWISALSGQRRMIFRAGPTVSHAPGVVRSAASCPGRWISGGLKNNIECIQ